MVARVYFAIVVASIEAGVCWNLAWGHYWHMLRGK